ncbi:hypothetical protein A2U01_0066375, partial [Trifolium medium]|nr:hypothetical protein [Trifolium medium]
MIAFQGPELQKTTAHADVLIVASHCLSPCHIAIQTYPKVGDHVHGIGTCDSDRGKNCSWDRKSIYFCIVFSVLICDLHPPLRTLS